MWILFMEGAELGRQIISPGLLQGTAAVGPSRPPWAAVFLASQVTSFHVALNATQELTLPTRDPLSHASGTARGFPFFCGITEQKALLLGLREHR